MESVRIPPRRGEETGSLGFLALEGSILLTNCLMRVIPYSLSNQARRFFSNLIKEEKRRQYNFFFKDKFIYK
jgi:hypothetical protein